MHFILLSSALIYTVPTLGFCSSACTVLSDTVRAPKKARRLLVAMHPTDQAAVDDIPPPRPFDCIPSSGAAKLEKNTPNTE